MKITLVIMSIFLSSLSQAQTCKETKSIGADYFQAKYNCEVIIGGNAQSCVPYGNMWSCSCVTCPSSGSGHFTRTIGSDYNQARYNCEVILKGRAGMCQPSTNRLWYCDCNY